MATNSASTGRSVSAPVSRFRIRAAVTPSSFPSTSSTTLSQMNRIPGWAFARSPMIREARSSPRRWITWTVVANRVRKSASSMAVSPPPTTAISFPR